ncbi:hypothetical protein GCM10011428_71070 [Streptomyces violaceus]|uniref:SGNH/GDSL hydrolase family protein n=1 Tax=Streptomyces violaceus TaxID=1936 RepID=UPI0031E5E934
MRGPWIVGVLLAGLLLGACGDPSSGPGTSPPSAPEVSTTTHQRAPVSPSPRAPAKAPRVLYLGDSLAMENQKVLGQELRRDLRAKYTSAPYSGTTLCDYLEGTAERSLVPARDKAAALVRSLRPDFVVLQFWGNAWDFTWCMDKITYDGSRERYFKRYEADARRLVEQITTAGGARRPRIVWVLQGPDPITPDRVRRVNGLYQRLAADSDDIVAGASASASHTGSGGSVAARWTASPPTSRSGARAAPRTARTGTS